LIKDIQVKEILKSQLNFSYKSIHKLEEFVEALLDYNKQYNLIAKSTESDVWNRHVLDSAQLVKYIDFHKPGSLADLGSGGGFPGLVLGIYNENLKFHVKLYEKSPVKCDFLSNFAKNENIEIIKGDVNNYNLENKYIVSRAFKKLPEILRFSRENVKKGHKLIVLKGKSAQDEINKALKYYKFDYKLEKSITDKDSKIIVVNF
jgi:16S rRNA (guanine527-N7)-methyltransferase